jgi:hypothetical protein
MQFHQYKRLKTVCQGGDLALKYRDQRGDMMSLKFEALDEHFALAMKEIILLLKCILNTNNQFRTKV